MKILFLVVSLAFKKILEGHLLLHVSGVGKSPQIIEAGDSGHREKPNPNVTVV